eukprot:TRINITY_DN1045_c0_g1_i2.p1 TRINITY_DN1045_c0_g1~~TRINITY_DN1045_c0_g1_i2.p1  ORF type:complete len:664 (-),score=157.16 TRINITY_DN1045_c0_g1_i2:256-2247(-)
MAQAEVDLTALQDTVKRDPEGYHGEFVQQYRHFESMLGIFTLRPPRTRSPDTEGFVRLVNFLAQVSYCFTGEMASFAQQVSGLLEQHAMALEPLVRRTLAKALILLRSRGQLAPSALLPLFFRLFRCPDKQLRTLLYHHIVTDITRANRKRRDNALNRTLINFMYTMLNDPTEIAARKSLDVMIDLYKQHVWNDSKTVNVISTGVFSKCTKIVVKTLHFFLGVPDKSSEEKSEALAKAKRLKFFDLVKKMQISKKTRSREKKYKVKKKTVKILPDEKTAPLPNWPAIELINDPNEYVRKVFGVLKTSREAFAVRLLLMNFIARLIAKHQLQLLGFYSFLLRYLKPHQQHIVNILALTAESCHSLVPPEAVQPVIKTLADEFITDRSSPEALSAGLNTVRAIAERCPLALGETLARDLVEYRKHQSHAIVTAARSLLKLVRQSNTALLQRKEKGKAAAEDPVAPLEFGEVAVHEDVDGIELLKKYRKKNPVMDTDEPAIERKRAQPEPVTPDAKQRKLQSGDISYSRAVSSPLGQPELNLDPQRKTRWAKHREPIAGPEKSSGILTQEDFELIRRLKEGKPATKCILYLTTHFSTSHTPTCQRCQRRRRSSRRRKRVKMRKVRVLTPLALLTLLTLLERRSPQRRRKPLWPSNRKRNERRASIK